ncbi:hypothetical protein B0O99DRAFT_714381 [Bisporella sp. PMI_857]|nr:hypothetical protein B0O99DRAFT_714381 [Bisporella sp. PMI_857]
MCEYTMVLIEWSIVDPNLRVWVLPSLTSTKTQIRLLIYSNDGHVAKVIRVLRGVLTITLLGEKSDHENIQRRIEKLTEYGKQPTRFAELTASTKIHGRYLLTHS